MKIGVAQMSPLWENKAHNMRVCRTLAEEARESGCELLVFPELTLTGFSMNPSLAEPPDGDSAEFFCGLSNELGIAIAFGAAVSENGRVYNRLCIAQNGSVIASYSKVHPFSYVGEDKLFSGGSSAEICEINGVRFGLSICYDLRFPELYRMLAERCDCIINIANWPQSRSAHWQALLKARAIENQCFIIGCNRSGEGNGIAYSGDSAVYSPDGEQISCAKPFCEEIVYAEVSRAEAEKQRLSFPVTQDMRRDVYIEFYRS